MPQLFMTASRDLLQLVLVAMSVYHIVWGLQGSTPEGLPVREGRRLTGRSGRFLGRLLVATGIVLAGWTLFFLPNP